MYIFEHLVEVLAFVIGAFGGFVILVGVYRAAKIYLQKTDDLFFQHSRMELSQHLLLGLDFLVAKDVLDTLALRTDAFILMNLVVLVGLRILLTHFVNKELQELTVKQQQINKKTTKKTNTTKKKSPKIIA